MIDISKTTEPKSDQMNADDLISGPVQIKIRDVKVPGGDQPVHIFYDGDNGKPYKPCLSMRRVMVVAWGKNGEDYIGRSMVLYRDPTVKWAGTEQGGIRISHMSHIAEKVRITLTKSRGKRELFVADILRLNPGIELTNEAYEGWKDRLEKAQTMDDLSVIGAEIKQQGYNESGANDIRKLYLAASSRVRAE